MIRLQKKFKQMLKYVDGGQMRDSQLLVRLSDVNCVIALAYGVIAESLGACPPQFANTERTQIYGY